MRTLHILTSAALATTLSWPMNGIADVEHAAPVKIATHDRLLEEVQDHAYHQLTHAIHSAMVSWAPSSTIVGTHSQDDFINIAKDVVEVVMDPKEPSLFDHDPAKYKTAVLLTTVAYFEGHFWPYVEDGTCNRTPRSDLVERNGTCDSGEAYSLWQIHPSNNIVLNWNVWAHAVDAHNPNIVTGVKLLEDRKLAARTALHMLRASLNRNHTLCEYTGERLNQPHPKADARLLFAEEYWTKHPF